jgi:hypothetical protein
MSSHTAGTPVASTSRSYIGHNLDPKNTSLEVSVERSGTVASTSKCCKRPNTGPQVGNYDIDRARKRQRQPSDTHEQSRTYQSQSESPMGEASASTMPKRRSSAIRDMSPPVDRRVPPINSAECCLGIVACDEQGEIVGWTS